MNATAISYPTQSALCTLLERELTSARLAKIAPGGGVDLRHWQACVFEPLSGFLARPGKEFRASLVRLGYRIAGGQEELPVSLAEMVEILHAGSLIVDDIEDESASRRGGPALHRQIGLPRALNLGNWLYFWPAQLLSELGLPEELELRLHRAMSKTLLDCHYGQALDLGLTLGEVRQDELFDTISALTHLKAGSLMGFSAELGAFAAGANRDTARALKEFGEKLGVGLQMLDDLGGLLSERRAHKGHEDLLGGRLTWAWAFLSGDLAAPEFETLRQLQAAVKARDVHPEILSSRMRPLLGLHRATVHQHLEAAFDELTRQVGLAPGVGDLRRTLAVLEKSYE